MSIDLHLNFILIFNKKVTIHSSSVQSSCHSKKKTQHIVYVTLELIIQI